MQIIICSGLIILSLTDINLKRINPGHILTCWVYEVHLVWETLRKSVVELCWSISTGQAWVVTWICTHWFQISFPFLYITLVQNWASPLVTRICISSGKVQNAFSPYFPCPRESSHTSQWKMPTIMITYYFSRVKVKVLQDRHSCYKFWAGLHHAITPTR